MILHGFVQAGGGSTRFGRDKALVELAGKSILQRTGELLAGICADIKIVAAAGKYADAAWQVVPDRWPGEGPLGGILTGLESVRHLPPDAAWALIVGCDMPFLSHEFLAFLRDTASRSSSQVVVPKSASGLEPLCACWSIQAAASIRAAFDSGIRKVTEAMKTLRMEVLDESAWKRFDTEGHLFWNLNTPDDLEAARRILEAPHP